MVCLKTESDPGKMGFIMVQNSVSPGAEYSCPLRIQGEMPAPALKESLELGDMNTVKRSGRWKERK